MLEASDLVTAEEQKANGAFYTDARVARFLVQWGVRDGTDRVLDPSFGGGVFLKAARDRLLSLGGDPDSQVFGVEMDAGVHAAVLGRLDGDDSPAHANLLRDDFFKVDGRQMAPVDCVVGNPPFIRYQRFRGAARDRALKRSAEAGVPLSRLTSSWAPFLVHAVSFLGEGGRMAVVVPAELAYAAYALPLLGFLRSRFRAVTLVTSRERLFPDVNEDTMLLLADGFGSGPATYRLRDLDRAQDLEALCGRGVGGRRLRGGALADGRERLTDSFIHPRALSIYREALSRPDVVRLGTIADIGIGYVSGANGFFHLSEERVRAAGIPRGFLVPAVRWAGDLVGVQYTRKDWMEGVARGEDRHLLRIPGRGSLPESVLRYIREGEKQGIHRAYKCRVREPWYRVPHVHAADAFLSYMSGIGPRLVANEAGAVAPNTLHIVRLLEMCPMTGEALAVASLSSLFRLSAELEGHSLGGGMLKLEPTEAGRIAVPMPGSMRALAGMADEVDDLCRQGKVDLASRAVDEVVLKGVMGVGTMECALVRRAITELRERRCRRGGQP